MSDFEEDFSENRENIDPRKIDITTSSRPIKMPLRNGSAAGESDSGYDLNSESSPSLSHAMTGLGPSDSEAGPDIADEEFRPANEIFKDPNAFDFLSQHGHGSTSAAALARECGWPSVHHAASQVNFSFNVLNRFYAQRQLQNFGFQTFDTKDEKQNLHD